MQGKGFGFSLLVLGMFLLLLFATADLVGVGADPRFGPKQIVGCLAGLVFAAWGAYLCFGRSTPEQK